MVTPLTLDQAANKLEELDRAGFYLEDNPPTRAQFRTERNASPTGAIAVHTTESITDTTGQDSGAEAVANFIRTRTTPGSYHTLTDADSIVRLGRYIWQMYGEGTGGNRWALHLSIATQASKWRALPDDWIEAAITNTAIAAAHMGKWMHDNYRIVVPAQRITADDYRLGRPGFIAHGTIDPGRRSDPGEHFPWETFLTTYRNLYMAIVNIDPDTGQTVNKPKEPPMPQHPTSILTGVYDGAVRDLKALYDAYRPSIWDLPVEVTDERTAADGQRGADIREWSRDLADKIYVQGDRPGPTLQYIHHELARTHTQKGNNQ